MTESTPFGGDGGFDMNSLLQQAQAMQEQLLSAQNQLEQQTVEGSSGPVTVTLTGTGELTGVRIDAASVDAQDAEALTDLGDFVVAAYRVAKSAADAAARETMNPLSGLGDALGGGGLDDALGGLLGGGPAEGARPDDERPGGTPGV
ncbi:MAG: YbaB/EbfC family nucleoid-associated protein [Nocardioides sp.]|nr:YbaB/EbfC family nucleoid-associated protein [Nocardioides sp.]